MGNACSKSVEVMPSGWLPSHDNRDYKPRIVVQDGTTSKVWIGLGEREAQIA